MIGKLCAIRKTNDKDVNIILFGIKSLMIIVLLPTADDMTAVVLILVTHVQQQVGAVGVGLVRVFVHLLTLHVEAQLSYTTDNAVRGQRLEDCIT